MTQLLDNPWIEGDLTEKVLRSKHSHEIVPANTRLTGVLAKYEIEARDESGIVVAKQGGPSRSFLRNFGRVFRQMFLVLSGTNDQITDVTGVQHQMALLSGIAFEGAIVPGSAATFRLGDSNAAVDSSQNDVQGTFLGETIPAVVTVLAEDSAHLQFKVEATALNNSGGAWVIPEFVLCAFMRQGDVGGQSRKVAMLRDIFAPITVNNGSTAVARYTFDIPI